MFLLVYQHNRCSMCFSQIFSYCCVFDSLITTCHLWIPWQYTNKTENTHTNVVESQTTTNWIQIRLCRIWIQTHCQLCLFFLFYNTMKLVNVVSPDSVLFCSVNYPSLWTCGVWYSFSLGYQKKAAWSDIMIQFCTTALLISCRHLTISRNKPFRAGR